jgi:hypothetical protein
MGSARLGIPDPGTDMAFIHYRWKRSGSMHVVAVVGKPRPSDFDWGAYRQDVKSCRYDSLICFFTDQLEILGS